MNRRNSLKDLTSRIFVSTFLSLGFVFGFLPCCADIQLAGSDHHLAEARIFVDPDLRVSYDGDVVHMEAYSAASATNPDLLVAGGELIVPGRRLNASEARLYRSTNAGALWNPVLLPDEVNGGWDNAVAGGIGESAYFLTSNLERGLTVYRTNDGGKTWISTVLVTAVGWDRPHVAVDVTASPYRGRFYVAGEADDGVRVMASSDGGQTFSSPVTACRHAQGWNAATTASPLILSDGTLVVPCAPYPDYPERASWTSAEVGIVSSSDGGRTFGPFRKMGVAHRALTRDMYLARIRGNVILSGNFMQGPSFAVAPSGALYADRLYAAWQDIDSTGSSQLLLTWSADRGTTWSDPLPVDPTGAAAGKGSPVQQGVPMVAVNRDGVLGVAWFDGRGAKDGKGYDVYFGASLNGGRSFLTSVRVSSVTSRPAQGLNILPALDIAKSERSDKTLIHMSSSFSERATGGDYSSMAVDAAGRFHPFWADARSGAWQLYSATIRVLSDKALSDTMNRAIAIQNPVTRTCNLGNSSVQLAFGEPTFDSSANEVTVPVRLINSSTDPILDAVEVRATTEKARGQWSEFVPDAAALVPKIFDATSNAFGDHATFLYPASHSSPLFPNGVTAPRDWRLHVPVPNFMNYSLQVEITGACP
jgi:hypothetical protein